MLLKRPQRPELGRYMVTRLFRSKRRRNSYAHAYLYFFIVCLKCLSTIDSGRHRFISFGLQNGDNSLLQAGTVSFLSYWTGGEHESLFAFVLIGSFHG